MTDNTFKIIVKQSTPVDATITGVEINDDIQSLSSPISLNDLTDETIKEASKSLEQVISGSSVKQVTEPEEEPVSATEEEPVAASEEEPVSASEEEPVAASEEEPVAASEEEPVAASEEEPVAASEEEPVAASEEEPVAASEEEPVAASEEEPAVKEIMNMNVIFKNKKGDEIFNGKLNELTEQLTNKLNNPLTANPKDKERLLAYINNNKNKWADTNKTEEDINRLVDTKRKQIQRLQFKDNELQGGNHTRKHKRKVGKKNTNTRKYSKKQMKTRRKSRGKQNNVSHKSKK